MTQAEQCKKLCDDGICKSECCGPVPFSKEVFNKNAYCRGKMKWERIDRAKDKEGNELFIPITKDMSCIFLHDKGDCAIYESRPEVCQKFGDESHKLLRCPYMDKNGKLRSKAETEKIKREMEK